MTDVALRPLPQKVTVYGGPKDGFVRIVDVLSRDGDALVVERTIVLKRTLESVTLTVKL
jgi:hypothetical protein